MELKYEDEDLTINFKANPGEEEDSDAFFIEIQEIGRDYYGEVVGDWNSIGLEVEEALQLGYLLIEWAQSQPVKEDA